MPNPNSARDALAGAIAAFHARTPPRIWSLIVSFLGDAILPVGGVVQAGVIAEFAALAQIDAGLVRTALSRLVAKGIVAREREGRRSFYRLTAVERARFEAAAELIYGHRLPLPTGAWDLVLIDAVRDRTVARAELDALGYAALNPTTFLRPQHRGRDNTAPADGLAFVGAADAPTRLAMQEMFGLPALAASHERFLARYAVFAEAEALPPEAALLARVLLVHDWRRVVLRDPFCPADALPANWPAAKARALFDAAHRALSPGAEAWLASLTKA